MGVVHVRLRGGGTRNALVDDVSGPDFSPHDVVVFDIPLVGTLDHAEAEIAAALIIRMCALAGAWGPVNLNDAMVLAAIDLRWHTRFRCWWTNPFLRPDPFDLARRGFAVLRGEGYDRTIELTPAAFERIAKWVRQ
jgi:hypothetical protein